MYQKAKWDIETVCELTNPTQGYPTCSAQAVTYRRRCKRQIAHGAISAIRDILEHLTTRSPCATAESPDLYEAAKLSVCWQHRDQIGDVARRWKEALKALARRTGKADGKASYSTHGGIKQEDEGDIPPSARRARGRKVNPESYEMRPEELSRLKEMLADRRAQEKRKEEATVKEEREKAEKERQRRRQEAEERQRRRQEAEERQRRHEREAEEKRKQEEREKREEILRQRARKRQQDREDAARKEWADAWKRYSEGWAEIEDASHHSKIKVEQLPWPVKSGAMEDVTPANIKQFFSVAPPTPASATAGEERYRTISRENKRWHTDKIMSRFGISALDGPCKNALNITAKVVVELRQEAQRSRRS